MNHIFYVFYFICFLNLQYANEYQTHFPVQENFLKNHLFIYDDLLPPVGILSLKRTGSSLTTAIITELTGSLCIWSILGSAWAKSVPLNRENSALESNKVPILGSHYLSDFTQFEGKLIMTLRDYKELFSRKGSLNSSYKEIKEYFDFLDFFDKWDQDKKFIVHYEQLINAPLELIESLSYFLEASPYRTHALLIDYDVFRNKVLNSYIIYPGETTNSIDKQVIHSSNISIKELKALENEMRNFNPTLFQKYLSRYSIKN